MTTNINDGRPSTALLTLYYQKKLWVITNNCINLHTVLLVK